MMNPGRCAFDLEYPTQGIYHGGHVEPAHF
jgi:hypothetical protein